MSNQKLVMYFTLLSIMFLGYFGAVAENEFYVKQKSQLEEKKIETEAKQEKLEQKLEDVKFSKEMSKVEKELEFLHLRIQKIGNIILNL